MTDRDARRQSAARRTALQQDNDISLSLRISRQILISRSMQVEKHKTEFCPEVCIHGYFTDC